METGHVQDAIMKKNEYNALDSCFIIGCTNKMTGWNIVFTREQNKCGNNGTTLIL